MYDHWWSKFQVRAHFYNDWNPENTEIIPGSKGCDAVMVLSCTLKRLPSHFAGILRSLVSLKTKFTSYDMIQPCVRRHVFGVLQWLCSCALLDIWLKVEARDEGVLKEKFLLNSNRNNRNIASLRSGMVCNLNANTTNPEGQRQLRILTLISFNYFGFLFFYLWRATPG